MLLQLPDHLQTHTPDDVTRSGLVSEIAAIAGARSALDAYEHRVVAAIDSLGDQGLDAAGVLRSVARVSDKTAKRVSSTAGRMADLPATAEALASGQITREHADVIADAAEKLSPEAVDVELSTSAASAPADVFAKRARRWVGRHETPAAIEDRYRQQRAARSLRTWTQPDGMGMWIAKLDPVTHAAVTAAVNTRYKQFWYDDGGRNSKPAGPNSDGTESDSTQVRSYEQRMADAFVSIITATNNTGTFGVGDPAAGAQSGATKPTSRVRADRIPGVRQQMLVTVDLTRMRTDPHGAAHLVDGTPLPQSVLEELACNSEMTGIVFDGPSKPIWIGRTRRHATSSQQKALIARDQGCVGCKKAPDRCEAHHVKPWHDGGATDIDNLVLVCSQCHHNIHNRGMRLTQTAGGNGDWQITHRNKPKPRAGLETGEGTGFEPAQADRSRLTGFESGRAGPQNTQSESTQNKPPRTGANEAHSQLSLA